MYSMHFLFFTLILLIFGGGVFVSIINICVCVCVCVRACVRACVCVYYGQRMKTLLYATLDQLIPDFAFRVKVQTWLPCCAL